MDRVKTHIPNLDDILGGGFPAASINIIAGGPGTGKTMLTHELVYRSASPENTVLFLTTVSEPMHKVLRYVQGFPFFDAEKVARSVHYEDLGQILQKGTFEEAMSFIGDLVQRELPAVLVIDSFKALSDLAPDIATFRRTLYKLTGTLTASGCTTFLLGEYNAEDMQRLPEFAVADSILEMTNERRGIRTYRYLSIAKLRGSGYREGKHAVRLTSDGVRIFPRFSTPETAEKYETTVDRVSTGVPSLDEKLGGGILPGSATLVVGATGTGKTLLGLSLVLEAVKRGERAVFVSFQEDPNQIRQIVQNFGWDLDAAVASKQLKLLYVSPVEIDMDEHIIEIVRAIDEVGAGYAVIDSLSDLEAAAYDADRFSSYVFSLVQYAKDKRLTMLMTLEAATNFAERTLTSAGASRTADNVLLLSDHRDGTHVRREMRIMKTRGMSHDHDVHIISIGPKGMKVGEAQ